MRGIAIPLLVFFSIGMYGGVVEMHWTPVTTALLILGGWAVIGLGKLFS
jgi:hypothetical protein